MRHRKRSHDYYMTKNMCLCENFTLFRPDPLHCNLYTSTRCRVTLLFSVPSRQSQSLFHVAMGASPREPRGSDGSCCFKTCGQEIQQCTQMTNRLQLAHKSMSLIRHHKVYPPEREPCCHRTPQSSCAAGASSKQRPHHPQ